MGVLASVCTTLFEDSLKIHDVLYVCFIIKSASTILVLLYLCVIINMSSFSLCNYSGPLVSATA
jgi:hypothetical protein